MTRRRHERRSARLCTSGGFPADVRLKTSSRAIRAVWQGCATRLIPAAGRQARRGPGCVTLEAEEAAVEHGRCTAARSGAAAAVRPAGRLPRGCSLGWQQAAARQGGGGAGGGGAGGRLGGGGAPRRSGVRARAPRPARRSRAKPSGAGCARIDVRTLRRRRPSAAARRRSTVRRRARLRRRARAGTSPSWRRRASRRKKRRRRRRRRPCRSPSPSRGAAGRAPAPRGRGRRQRAGGARARSRGGARWP